MAKTRTKDVTSPIQVTIWKSRYERQKILIDSILSLLTKYGSALDLENLRREFLLTIMGQFLAGDCCYYAVKEEIGHLQPVLSYGKLNRQTLPPINLGSQLVSFLNQARYPSRISKIADPYFQKREIKILADHFSIISSLFLKERLLGVVFLGEKISSQPYTDSDLSLLHSFCAVSAMTFSHARLFQNAKLSIAELQKLNDMRKDILDRITHEFRTPLTVIKSGISALKLKDEKSDVAFWITESVSRLETLIDSLLELNNSYLDDSPLSLYDWNPVTVLQEIVSAHSKVASRRNISIEIRDVPADALPQLKLNPERFRNVLNNLIDNAIKFSNDSTSVVITFEGTPRRPDEERDGIQLPDWKEQFKKRIGQYYHFSDFDWKKGSTEESELPADEADRSPSGPSQRFIVLRIKDGGIGIPAEEITSLSEPFQQASNSPDIGVKGKGLGLAVCQKILSSCGGQIYCRSEEGKGTTFTVFFPLR